MNAMEFWQQSEGEWFSHRTSHDIAQQHSESVKSQLEITLTEPIDVDAVRQAHSIEVGAALKELKIETYGDLRRDGDSPLGSLTLLLVPDSATAPSGRLLHNESASTYALDADGVLSVTSDRGELHVEERIWFESPNLRLRTSSVMKQGNLIVASFFSEIRRVTAPPKS